MIDTVKRIASDLLGVGVNKIRIKKEEIKKAENALTREDVRNLIKEKVIYIKSDIKKKKNKKAKKRKINAGSRKGAKNARTKPKKSWMKNVRAQRALLKDLILNKKLDKKYKKLIYSKIKGGAFKGKNAMLLYLKENNMLIEEKKA